MTPTLLKDFYQKKKKATRIVAGAFLTAAFTEQTNTIEQSALDQALEMCSIL